MINVRSNKGDKTSLQVLNDPSTKLFQKIKTRNIRHFSNPSPSPKEETDTLHVNFGQEMKVARTNNGHRVAAATLGSKYFWIHIVVCFV